MPRNTSSPSRSLKHAIRLTNLNPNLNVAIVASVANLANLL